MSAAWTGFREDSSAVLAINNRRWKASMSSEGSFAKALAAGFASDGMKRLIAKQAQPSYVIGDGTEVVLGDSVCIPEKVCGSRVGQWGEVVSLADDGLGIRFTEKVAGITREFFEWSDLSGARASAVPRARKRISVTPPASEHR